MKTALITGSETFGKYITNPTKWLALATDGKIIQRHRIHSLIFPSIILLPNDAENHGEIIVRKARQIKADVIISFGLASTAKGFRLEKCGSNWIENDDYASAYENKRAIDSEKPAHERVEVNLTLWDIIKIKKSFAKNKIPFDPVISENPGQYSCNAWIYRTLKAMKKNNLKIPYLFVHTACTKKSIEFIPDFPNKKVLIKERDLIKALEIFLESYII